MIGDGIYDGINRRLLQKKLGIPGWLILEAWIQARARGGYTNPDGDNQEHGEDQANG